MKFCVIGLGRFGYQVAITLAENGMEVIAVDSNESIIASIRDKVTQAICMRVNDEEALKTIGVDDTDAVVVAMGENFAQSILITAILKQRLKIPMVITRSISFIHRDILQIIGADEVILPEQEVGQRLANTLSLPFRSIIQITPDFGISQLQAPVEFLNKSIKDLNIEQDYHVKCIGRKDNKNNSDNSDNQDNNNNNIIPIDQNYIVLENDILVFSGSNKDLAKIAKL